MKRNKRLIFLITILTLSSTGITQVIYTDIVPDRNYQGLPEIDIDHDGIADVKLHYEKGIKYDASVYNFTVLPADQVEIVVYNDSVACLGFGNIIDGDLEWSDSIVQPFFYWWHEYSEPTGNWKDVEDGFIGIRKKIQNQYKYAWIRVNSTLPYPDYPLPVFEAADHAIELTHNKPIICGTDIPGMATSVYGKDLDYNTDAVTIKASFTKAKDEALYSGYRAIVAKANDTTALDLDVMNQVPEDRYKQIIVDTLHSPHVYKFSHNANSLDKDGNSVGNVIDYRVHILNMSKSGIVEDNKLSEPSPSFYLRADVCLAEINVAYDEGDSNGSQDIRIKFKKSDYEENAIEYRIFIVPVDTSSDFNVDTAILLTEEYYTSTLPSGLDQELSLKANQLDIESKPIEENKYYQCYVLTVPNPENARMSILSNPSRKFVVVKPGLFYAGQIEGDNLRHFTCDSLFSESSFWEYGYSHFLETYIDVNRDGTFDYVLYGKHAWSQMFEEQLWHIESLRDNKIMVCDHENHDGWIDVLKEKEAISADNSWYQGRTILLDNYYNYWNGANHDWGHMDCRMFNPSCESFIGFCVMDNSEPQLAWMRLYGTEFIDYAYQDVDNSIDEKTDKVEIQVYPNPASTSIWIRKQELNGESEDYTIEFINSFGQVVDRLHWNGKPQQYDVSKYSAGIFVLRFTNSNIKITTRRLIIQ